MQAFARNWFRDRAVRRKARGLGTMIAETDATIRRIEFELEKAEHGMAMPYDPERVGQLRKMLVEARKRKLSDGLAKRRRLSARHEG